MTPIEKAARAFVNQFKKDVGYHEKATNAQLDDPKANSGSNNWNKFAAFIDGLRAKGLNFYNGRKNIGPQGEWCDSSYDTEMIWFIMSLGFDEIEAAELAMQMLYQPANSCGAGCSFSADYYRAAGAWFTTPKIGDQFFIGKKGDESHTGAVAAVDATYIYTVEGNYNNQVSERKIRRDDASISGYGRPNYELIAYKFVEPAGPDTPIEDDKTSLSADELAQVEALVDKKLEDALGKMIVHIDDIPWASVRKEMRKLLDAEAIDGGTPYEEDPDDIRMPLNIVRALVALKRYVVTAITEALRHE